MSATSEARLEVLRAQVLRLRRAGLTFKEIGRALDPPVTRQRAHQLYKEATNQ